MVACALILVAVTALAGCGSSGNKKTSQGTTSQMEVTKGQDFTISLQANPTTGYAWELAEPLNEKVVKKVKSVYQPSATTTETDKVGSGGVEIWTFNAVGKGKDDIKMQYVRPSDKGAKPAEERTFSVTVK
jgi:inhibitor of cysteine peptidase